MNNNQGADNLVVDPPPGDAETGATSAKSEGKEQSKGESEAQSEFLNRSTSNISPKAMPSKEELEKLYCHDHLSMREIADKFVISTRTALRWLKKHGIKSRLPFNLKLIEQAELEKLVAQGMSQNEIAKKLGVHKKTVYNWLQKYGVKTDPAIKRRKNLLAKSLTERNLRNLYVRGGLSIKKIAKHYKVHFRTIRKLLLEFQIPLRKTERKLASREELYDFYVRQGLTTREIGAKYAVSDTTIVRWLRRYQINLRRGGPNPNKPRFTREQLIQYRKLTIKEIARIFGVPRETIRYWLGRYDIKVQHGRRERQLRFTRNQLSELYVAKQLDASQIAQLYRVSESIIRYWLHRYRLKKWDRPSLGHSPLAKHN